MSDITSKFHRFRNFEVAEFNCPRHVFPKHSHDEFVISANVTGSETVTLDRRTFEVTTDQITLYNPAQVQSSHASSSNWSFVSVYLRPCDFAVLAGVEESVVFDHPSPKSARSAKALISFVVKALDGSTKEDVLELELGELLLDLLAVSGTAPPCDRRPSGANMRKVAELLLDHIDEPPRLADIAAQYGMNAVGLVRAFKKDYGLPPFEWLNVQRINFARERLRRGFPLNGVAHDLGYADQPHFNRRFKAATGLTPSTFLRVK